MSKSLDPCPSCGTALTPGARYCRSCGTSTAGPADPHRRPTDSRRSLGGPVIPWVLVGALSAAIVVVLMVLVVRSGSTTSDRRATPTSTALTPEATAGTVESDPARAEGVAMSTASLFIDGIRDSLSGRDDSQADGASTPQARADLIAVFAQLGAGAQVVGAPDCMAGSSAGDVECEVDTDRGPIVLAVRLTSTSPTGALVAGVRVG